MSSHARLNKLHFVGSVARALDTIFSSDNVRARDAENAGPVRLCCGWISDLIVIVLA